MRLGMLRGYRFGISKRDSRVRVCKDSRRILGFTEFPKERVFPRIPGFTKDPKDSRRILSGIHSLLRRHVFSENTWIHEGFSRIH